MKLIPKYQKGKGLVRAVSKVIDKQGKIRLQLPEHTVARPREFVLEPQGDNQYYVHMRTWDGDHIPAQLSPEQRKALFEAAYGELPQEAIILAPKSNPEYLATRGTVAGIKRLERDPRFIKWGQQQPLMYTDKDGNTKEMLVTGFRKHPRITLENPYGNLKFIRNLSGMPTMNGGRVQLGKSENGLVNLTSDLPFRLHKQYSSAPGSEYLIIDPRALRGQTPLSIEPMDTFFPNNEALSVDPKYVGIISGNPEVLEQAGNAGLQTYTNDKLKELWKAMQPTQVTRLSKGPMSSDYAPRYRQAIDEFLTKNIGRPSLDDYRSLEQMTGLKAGIEQYTDQLNRRKQIIDFAYDRNNFNVKTPEEWANIFKYPNHRTEGIMDLIYPSVRSPLDYKEVFYDPTPHVEWDLMQKYGLSSHPGIIDTSVIDQIIRDLGAKPLKRKGGKFNKILGK